MKSEKLEPRVRTDVVETPDIESRTFQFAVRIVRLSDFLDSIPGVRRRLSDQLVRCGTSIGANVAEAQAGQSRADFLSKMNIALKEAREVVYFLRLLAATELVSPNQLASITREAEEIKLILGAIVRTTRATPGRS